MCHSNSRVVVRSSLELTVDETVVAIVNNEDYNSYTIYNCGETSMACSELVLLKH